MTRLNSVFRDEIKMHLSVREAELSHVLLTHTYLTSRHQCISTLPFFRPFPSRVRQLPLYR